MIKNLILLTVTNSFRTAIKESLINNPRLDLSNQRNVDLLTEDILKNIADQMENFITLLKGVGR